MALAKQEAGVNIKFGRNLTLGEIRVFCLFRKGVEAPVGLRFVVDWFDVPIQKMTKCGSLGARCA